MISLILLIVIILLAIGIVGDIGFGGVILLCLGAVGIIVVIAYANVKRDENLKKNNPEAWERLQAQRKQAEQAAEERQRISNAKKYNNYQYTCPMCQSKKIRNLSFDEKTDPFKASSRVGKNYHCDNCKYIW